MSIPRTFRLTIPVKDEEMIKKLSDPKVVDVTFARHVDLVFSVRKFLNSNLNEKSIVLEFKDEDKKKKFMKEREVFVNEEAGMMLKGKDFVEEERPRVTFVKVDGKREEKKADTLYVNLFHVPAWIENEDLIEAVGKQFDEGKLVKAEVQLRVWHKTTHNGSRSMTLWVEPGARPRSNFLFPDVKGIKLASEWAAWEHLKAWKATVQKLKGGNDEEKASALPRSAYWASSRKKDEDPKGVEGSAPEAMETGDEEVKKKAVEEEKEKVCQHVR